MSRHDSATLHLRWDALDRPWLDVGRELQSGPQCACVYEATTECVGDFSELIDWDHEAFAQAFGGERHPATQAQCAINGVNIGRVARWGLGGSEPGGGVELWPWARRALKACERWWLPRRGTFAGVLASWQALNKENAMIPESDAHVRFMLLRLCTPEDAPVAMVAAGSDLDAIAAKYGLRRRSFLDAVPVGEDRVAEGLAARMAKQEDR